MQSLHTSAQAFLSLGAGESKRTAIGAHLVLLAPSRVPFRLAPGCAPHALAPACAFVAAGAGGGGGGADDEVEALANQGIDIAIDSTASTIRDAATRASCRSVIGVVPAWFG